MPVVLVVLVVVAVLGSRNRSASGAATPPAVAPQSQPSTPTPQAGPSLVATSRHSDGPTQAQLTTPGYSGKGHSVATNFDNTQGQSAAPVPPWLEKGVTNIGTRLAVGLVGAVPFVGGIAAPLLNVGIKHASEPPAAAPTPTPTEPINATPPRPAQHSHSAAVATGAHTIDVGGTQIDTGSAPAQQVAHQLNNQQ